MCSQTHHSTAKKRHIVIVSNEPPLVDILKRQLRRSKTFILHANIHAIQPMPCIDEIKSIQPHVLLLAPSNNNITELTSLIEDWQGVCPTMKIIICYPGGEHFCLSSCANVEGYITQHDIKTELIPAVKAVLYNAPYFSQQIIQQMAHQTLETQTPSGLATLSRIELSVLLHLAQGKSLTAISELLHVTKRTVALYRHHLFHKLRITIKNNLLTI